MDKNALQPAPDFSPSPDPLTPAEEWLSVTDAAARVGIPARTLHRWVKSGSLRGRSDGKKRLVPLAEALKLAGNRVTAPPTGPASAGTGPWRAPGAGTLAPVNDGELSARVFTLLSEGTRPEQIVMEQHLPPVQVLAIADQWARLRAAGKPGGPTLPEQVKANRDDINAVSRQLDTLVNEQLPATFGEHSNETNQLKREINAGFQAVMGRLQRVEQILASMPQYAHLFRR